VQGVQIVPTANQYMPSFRATLDVVARERKYLVLLEAPPLEAVRSFVRQGLDDGGVQMLAVAESETVVGWCDIWRSPRPGLGHSGVLGVGLLPDYRDRGIGRRLIEETLRAARRAKLERIELEVYPDNLRAIGLYRKLGFVTEGTKRRASKLEGVYRDKLFMALFQEPE